MPWVPRHDRAVRHCSLQSGISDIQILPKVSIDVVNTHVQLVRHCTLQLGV